MPLICLSVLSPSIGGVEHMECEIKLEGPASPDVEPGKEETEESKKRKRKPYRPGEVLGWAGGAASGSPPGPPVLLIPQLCLFSGIGGFMVRQRKSHTRVKKGPAAQAEVLSGDGQPDEGETGEGTSGTWERVGITVLNGSTARWPGGSSLKEPGGCGRPSSCQGGDQAERATWPGWVQRP